MALVPKDAFVEPEVSHHGDLHVMMESEGEEL